MSPYSDQCPVTPCLLKPNITVMDVIYNPPKTKLLKLAEHLGCHVIDGVSMFVHQAAEQLRLWTQTDPPLSLMEKIVREALKDPHGEESDQRGHDPGLQKP